MTKILYALLFLLLLSITAQAQSSANLVVDSYFDDNEISEENLLKVFNSPIVQIPYIVFDDGLMHFEYQNGDNLVRFSAVQNKPHKAQIYFEYKPKKYTDNFTIVVSYEKFENPEYPQNPIYRFSTFYNPDPKSLETNPSLWWYVDDSNVQEKAPEHIQQYLKIQWQKFLVDFSTMVQTQEDKKSLITRRSIQEVCQNVSKSSLMNTIKAKLESRIKVVENNETTHYLTYNKTSHSCSIRTIIRQPNSKDIVFYYEYQKSEREAMVVIQRESGIFNRLLFYELNNLQMALENFKNLQNLYK